MEKRAGTFIVIEGIDGAGKSTQFDLLQKRLKDNGYDVAVFQFPRYEHPGSYFVRRYLDGEYGSADAVGPYTSSLFYALDRFEAAPEIRQALSEGKIVLCDRFSGSNMAHQGAKIANAEQRRGFFIWLDNLEFELLRVPRPDVNLVLRVPHEISLKLIAERGKRDIHENDETHIQRTAIVYEDLLHLFPQDFQGIDCARSDKLLDIDTINNMLWEKIKPLLPVKRKAKPAKTAAAAAVSAKTKTEESSDKNKTSNKNAADKDVAKEPEQPDAKAAIEEAIKEAAKTAAAETQITLESSSVLLLQKVERLLGKVQTDHPDVPSVYTPGNLKNQARKDYESKTSALLGLHAKLMAGLGKRGVEAKEAARVCSLALPLSVTTKITIDISHPNLEEAIVSLINDPLPEAQNAGAAIFAQVVKSDPGRFKGKNNPVKRTAPAAVRALAEEYLGDDHSIEQTPLQLAATWPRNETDLIADMLYEHSALPLRTIQYRVQSWPMARKLAVFEAYAGDTRPGVVLEKAHYCWDLVTTYPTFLELQRYPAEALETQTLTPRYGYDVPGIIEEANLADTFQKCFDLSLELYSILQSAGQPVEAQYAVLHGHNQRWKMLLNARQMINLCRRGDWPVDTQKLLAKMQEKIAEVHPMIGENLSQSVAQTEVPQKAAQV